MNRSAKITPNLDYPNNEPADLEAENMDPGEAQALGAPRDPSTSSERRNRDSSKSGKTDQSVDKTTTIEEQENEDLEVDEGLEDGNPEKPGNVPRF